MNCLVLCALLCHGVLSQTSSSKSLSGVASTVVSTVATTGAASTRFQTTGATSTRFQTTGIPTTTHRFRSNTASTTTQAATSSPPFTAYVSGIYLLDVVNGGVLSIANGGTLDVSSLESLTLLAQTVPSTVGCVWFDYNGAFYSYSPTSPYSVTAKNGSYSFVLGSNQWAAMPYEYDNGGSIANSGPSGAPYSIQFAVVKTFLDPNTLAGPQTLLTGPTGDSWLQMQAQPVSSDATVTALDILFNAAVNGTGNYQIRVYSSAGGGSFTLASNQNFIVDNVALMSTPAHVVLNPPVSVLNGQYIAIASTATVLPLPSTEVGNSNSPIYLSNTAVSSSINSNMIPTLTSTAISWRAQLNTVPNGTIFSIGVIIGIAAGGGLLLIIIIGVVVFLVWRSSRRIYQDSVSIPPEKTKSDISIPANVLHHGLPIQTVALEEAIKNPPKPLELDTFRNNFVRAQRLSVQPRAASLEAGEEVPCGKCQKSADVGCVQCRNFLCQTCSDHVHQIGKKHIIRPLKKVLSDKKIILFCPECGGARIGSNLCESCGFNFALVLPAEDLRVYD